jgi:hypothetical protein
MLIHNFCIVTYLYIQYNNLTNTEYLVHLPNDTLSIAFENTVFSLIPKENATVSTFNRFCFEMVRQITLSIELS